MTLEMSECAETEGPEETSQDLERYVTLFKLEQEEEDVKWVEIISGFISAEPNEVLVFTHID